MNPLKLKESIESACAATNVACPTVAAVHGDVLSGEQLDNLRNAGHISSFGQLGEEEVLWTRDQMLLSCNAYLGAYPIAHALDAGADIVVTGRVVDSALVLGPLIHESGWRNDDFDRLSAGSLAGHIIECGSVLPCCRRALTLTDAAHRAQSTSDRW